jgi:D-amino-acid oxidase
MNRRRFVVAAGAAGLSTACGPGGRHASINAPSAPHSDVPALPPIRAELDRIFRITVCLRPFRAAGPRLDVEKVGDKVVVHNYGHGGSGWSLSWGSGTVAVEKAMAAGEREIAVIGCGAIGLTSAIVAQRAGAKVTIYAKERPPEVRSCRATGSWTPDSRVALSGSVSSEFPALWEKMARTSWHSFESYLGLAGDPVEWLDRYALYDDEPGEVRATAQNVTELDFARYSNRIADLTPRSHELSQHPFPTKYARRGSSLTFNIASYSHQLLTDFLLEGGKIERREFTSPADLQSLPQKVIINATGYGARALWKDDSIVPVRGQIAWLIPQPDTHYSVFYKGVNVLARRDGIVVQDTGIGEMDGYNDTNETADRASAEASVQIVADLFRRMARRA